LFVFTSMFNQHSNKNSAGTLYSRPILKTTQRILDFWQLKVWS
jgi:hypothetical protein